jgi:hypothetical protein
MVTVKIIRQKIVDWQNDKIAKEELQKWGEEKYMSDEMHNSKLNKRDREIVIEVLQYLEFMNINTTIKDDIPYVLEFMDSNIPYKEAYKKWDQYLDGIDYKKRARELKHDPFYAPYCRQH